MRLRIFTAGLAAVAVAMAALASPPAAAASKKKSASQKTEQNGGPRARTRVTVQRRSFLDAGPNVPGERKFLDYAFPPAYSPLDVLGPGQDFRRRPLLDPWDVPGSLKY